MAVLFGLREAVASVALQPGTTIEFATVQQGREALTNRDEFIQMMGQFDKGRIVALLIRRGSNSLYIPFRIDGN